MLFKAESGAKRVAAELLAAELFGAAVGRHQPQDGGDGQQVAHGIEGQGRAGAGQGQQPATQGWAH